jgi:hypothetical protein
MRSIRSCFPSYLPADADSSVPFSHTTQSCLTWPFPKLKLPTQLYSTRTSLNATRERRLAFSNRLYPYLPYLFKEPFLSFMFHVHFPYFRREHECKGRTLTLTTKITYAKMDPRHTMQRYFQDSRPGSITNTGLPGRSLGHSLARLERTASVSESDTPSEGIRLGPRS